MLSLSRGTILKCRFPFEDSPNSPGPAFHYCLFSTAIKVPGVSDHLIVAYGTSRLDDALLDTQGHKHGVLSVSSNFIKGTMPGSVTHFVARHIAVVPAAWVDQRFNARLDFIRLESRKDQYRRQLFQQFEAFEHAMDEASEALYIEFLKTGKPGLAPGSNLRHTR